MLTDLILKTTRFFEGDPKRIQHLLKVHSYAVLIGTMENLNEEEMRVLEAAAIVHDVGIKKAEELYGYNDGKLQEQFGPDAAEQLLIDCDFKKVEISRICYLVGHHHSYDKVDGKDFRILVEADFIVNLYEDGASPENIRNAYERIFVTESGREVCRTVYNIAI